jgi:hypothetical protein
VAIRSSVIALAAAVLLVGCTHQVSLGKRPQPTWTVGAGPIASENALPGNADWEIHLKDAARAGEIQGYASTASVEQGQSIDFFVSTREEGVAVNAKIYRMGWYGGSGARLVEAFASQGRDQGWWSTAKKVGGNLPKPDPATGLVELHWVRSFSVTIPSDWLTGYYLMRLSENRTQKASYVIFVVRSKLPTAPLLVQASFATYEAYNDWGGASLYRWYDAFSGVLKGGNARAVKVSFDRPYADNFGASDFLYWEYNFVRWAERLGIDMDYSTDLDTHEQPSILQRYRGLVVLGHDEYWSQEMRDGVESARDIGVSLAFLGSNDGYWKIRFERSTWDAKDRIEVCYKSDADPLYQASQSSADSTNLWRSSSVGRPESELIGVMLVAVGHGDAEVSSLTPSWLFQGTGLARGQILPGLIGDEFDGVPQSPYHSSLTVLFTGEGRDAATGHSNHFESTIYTAASGAIVFAAGTEEWPLALATYRYRDTLEQPGLQQFTLNLINRMARSVAPAPISSFTLRERLAS